MGCFVTAEKTVEVTVASTQCFHPPLGKRRLQRHGGVVCKFIWKIWKMDKVGQVGRGQGSVLPMDSPRLDAMSPPRSARRFSRSQERGVLNGFFRCRVKQDTTSESTNLF